MGGGGRYEVRAGEASRRNEGRGRVSHPRYLLAATASLGAGWNGWVLRHCWGQGRQRIWGGRGEGRRGPHLCLDGEEAEDAALGQGVHRLLAQTQIGDLQ